MEESVDASEDDSDGHWRRRCKITTITITLMTTTTHTALARNPRIIAAPPLFFMTCCFYPRLPGCSGSAHRCWLVSVHSLLLPPPHPQTHEFLSPVSGSSYPRTSS